MKRSLFLLLALLSLIITSCKVNYSFTGISIGEAQTISIAYFPNNSQLAPPTYSQEFTESLKDIFLQQTKLDIVTKNGDMQITGEITGYTAQPLAITGNQVSALNRLSITVKVKFVNTLEEKNNFEKPFTRYVDYDPSEQLSVVEERLIPVINEQLTQDILQAAIGNW